MAPQAVVATAADGADVVVPLVHLGQQQMDVFRGVLQVGVQGDDAFAARMGEAGQNGAMLAEVAVEQDDAGHVRPGMELAGQQ